MWVAAALNYLQTKYCREVTGEAPDHDQSTQLSEMCFQYSGHVPWRASLLGRLLRIGGESAPVDGPYVFDRACCDSDECRRAVGGDVPKWQLGAVGIWVHVRAKPANATKIRSTATYTAATADRRVRPSSS
jgi:hypothetical protein